MPFDAEPATAYDVIIEFLDGSTTEGGGVFSYVTGAPSPPEITALAYDTGPAGDLLAIRGNGLFSGFRLPTVEFTRDDTATEAKVVAAFPGFGDHPEQITVRIPETLTEGTYDVTVTTGGGTSHAVAFTVADLPLRVTSMEPTSQGLKGPHAPVVIKGTGFGVFEISLGGPIAVPAGSLGTAGNLDVTWDDGSGDAPRNGFVLFHTSREILVIPPGAWFDPLSAGEYTVRVVLHPDSDDSESVFAGTYTVK